MQLCSIIIPIYKEELSDTEIISLRRCLMILGKYKICFVTFKHLNTLAYTRICNQYNVKPYFEFFDKGYFLNGVQGYNQLMLTIQFYKRFLSYTYILIYQLDAYVFRDELEYWCKKKYSFIGGPVFRGYNNSNSTSAYLGFMNGGLSLRKTKDMIRMITGCIKIDIFENQYEKQNIFHKIKALVMIFCCKLDSYTFQGEILNEDAMLSKFFIERIKSFNHRPKILSKVLNICIIDYHFPPFDDTFRFSFDENIEYLFALSGGNLPSFCHSFHKAYKRAFWQKYIGFDTTDGV